MYIYLLTYKTIYIYIYIFNHPPIDEHLDYFQLVIVTNNAGRELSGMYNFVCEYMLVNIF